MRPTAVACFVCLCFASACSLTFAADSATSGDGPVAGPQLNWIDAHAIEEKPAAATEEPAEIETEPRHIEVAEESVEAGQDEKPESLAEQGASLILPEFRVSRRLTSPANKALDTSQQETAGEAESIEKPKTANQADPAISEPPITRPAFSSQETALRNQIRRTLGIYYQRRLNTRDHGPWEIMHSVVPFGVDAMVEEDGPGGTPITAIGWLCFNRPARGLTLFTPHRDTFVTRQGPGMQGHEGQLLAILAQAKLQSDYPLQVGNREFSIEDLIEYEKQTCRPNAEHTFKLIALAHYLDTNDQWTNDLGQAWSIERLTQEELVQPIRGAACGGCHRLFGLAYAVQRRQKAGEPIDGVFARTQKYVRDYQRYTYSLQNRDGSFSTRWFEGREDTGDTDRKMKTTGHMLEFMLYTLPSEELDNPRITHAVTYLNRLLAHNASRKWENGPLGHAVHALALYNQRRFGEPRVPGSPSPASEIAADTNNLSPAQQ